VVIFLREEELCVTIGFQPGNFPFGMMIPEFSFMAALQLFEKGGGLVY
jgi:hypothetical protein